MTRTQQGDDIDLFDDGDESHSSANGTHRQTGDNNDASCGPGKKESLRLEIFGLVYRKSTVNNSYCSCVLDSWNDGSVLRQVQKVCWQTIIWPNRTWLSLQSWSSCVSAAPPSPSTACSSNHRRCGAGCCCWRSRSTSAKPCTSTWWVAAAVERRGCSGSDGAASERYYLVLFQYLVLLKKLPAEDSLSPEEFDSLLRPLS